jgi:hypothetical protein
MVGLFVGISSFAMAGFEYMLSNKKKQQREYFEYVNIKRFIYNIAFQNMDD